MGTVSLKGMGKFIKWIHKALTIYPKQSTRKQYVYRMGYIVDILTILLYNTETPEYHDAHFVVACGDKLHHDGSRFSVSVQQIK